MPIVTGCSAAWLAHLLWEQGVVGSNPTIPTKNLKKLSENYFAELFLFINCKGRWKGPHTGEFAAFDCWEFATFVAVEFASLRIAVNLRPKTAVSQNHHRSDIGFFSVIPI